jgi:outer membrane protein OmpA-like peptidoglycan-associated protein
MNVTCCARGLALAIAMGSPAAQAQTVEPAPATTEGAKPQTGAPAPLVIHFDTGSNRIRPEDRAVLDHASRAYSEGKPLVMILTGSADRVGAPGHNLSLSHRRAMAVLNALLDRGIPADRFQIVAKGETELVVPTQEDVSEAENRRVEITWR